MPGRTLYDKLWDSHVVRTEDDGTALIYIDRHLVHEVTSPQAYEGLRLAGRKPWRVDSVVAPPDHHTPPHDSEDAHDHPNSPTEVGKLGADLHAIRAQAPLPLPHARQRTVHGI